MQVDPFEPAKLTSLSFIAPMAESLLYLQVAVGRAWSPPSAMVLGVLAGAAVTAIVTGTARWEGFDNPAQLAKSAIGGLLMGFGGLLAAGCSIGQGADRCHHPGLGHAACRGGHCAGCGLVAADHRPAARYEAARRRTPGHAEPRTSTA